jgi:hypothetical protein
LYLKASPVLHKKILLCIQQSQKGQGEIVLKILKDVASKKLLYREGGALQWSAETQMLPLETVAYSSFEDLAIKLARDSVAELSLQGQSEVLACMLRIFDSEIVDSRNLSFTVTTLGQASAALVQFLMSHDELCKEQNVLERLWARLEALLQWAQRTPERRLRQFHKGQWQELTVEKTEKFIAQHVELINQLFAEAE